MIGNIELDAHSSEPAIVIKYEEVEAGEAEVEGAPPISSSSLQKIVHLKDLSEGVEAGMIAKAVLRACPIIPEQRVGELEQLIFYLQRRAAAGKDSRPSTASTTQSTSTPPRARIEQLDEYIEMLYEEGQQMERAVALLLELSCTPAHTDALVANEVLMGALMRVYRGEDSRNSFELATNVANLLRRLSQYARHHPSLIHHKVGVLTMQLVEGEFRRGALWREQLTGMDERNRRKWLFAMQKQDALLGVCLQILINLAEDLKIELKMLKRGLIAILLKCVEHTDSTPSLLHSATEFILKLSLFIENRRAMEEGEVLPKLIALLSSATCTPELRRTLFSVLFNFSHDPNSKQLLIRDGLLNAATPFIESDPTALALLYQLSTVGEGRTLLQFSEAINTASGIGTEINSTKLPLQLCRMLLAGKGSPNVVKALLVNAALEKRNAQLICAPNGKQFDAIMKRALDKQDLLMLKIVRNVSEHEGHTQEMFQKWLPPLIEHSLNALKSGGDHHIGVECLGIVGNLGVANWVELDTRFQLLKALSRRFEMAAFVGNDEGDDLLLGSILLLSTMFQRLEMAKRALQLLPTLVALIKKKKSDDELVLQLLHAFFVLASHAELSGELFGGGEESQMVECCMGLMEDKNGRLRALANDILQLAGEASDFWRGRINERKFQVHNAQWLEMVKAAPADADFGSGVYGASSMDQQSLDAFSRMVFDAEEILNEGDALLKMGNE